MQKRFSRRAAAIAVLLCMIGDLASGAASPMTANRTVTCGEAVAATSQAAPDAPVLIEVPPAGPDDFLIAECADGAADGRNVTFAAAPGAQLVLDDWRQQNGSVAVVPANGASDLEDVTVVVTGATAVSAGGAPSVHAISLVATGSVRGARLEVWPGAVLSCSGRCHRGPGMAGCTAASVFAEGGNVSSVLLMVRGATVNASAEVGYWCGAVAGSVVATSNTIEHAEIVASDSVITARTDWEDTSSIVGYATAVSFATGRVGAAATNAVYRNVTVRVTSADVIAVASVFASAVALLPIHALNVRVVDAALHSVRTSAASTAIRTKRDYVYGGGVAVATGVAAVGLGNARQTLTVEVIVDSFDSSISARDGLVVAAVGVASATARVASMSNGFADTATNVSRTTISATGCNVSAISSSPGAAAAAVGVATSSSSSGERSSANTNVTGVTIAARGSAIFAESSGSYAATAAAVGVATASSSKSYNRGSSSTSNVTDTTIAVMGGYVSAMSGTYGSAAAAVGVATSSHGNGRSKTDATVARTTIAATGSKVSVVSTGRTGFSGAAAAVSAVTSSSSRGDSGSSSSGRSSQSASSNTVTGTAIAVKGCTVSAASSSYGSAAMAGGVGSSSYSFADGSVSSSASSAHVKGTTIAVTGGNVSAVSGRSGTAAGAVCVAVASWSKSTGHGSSEKSTSSSPATITVQDMSIAAFGSNVSAVAGTESTAAGAVGFVSSSSSTSSPTGHSDSTSDSSSTTDIMGTTIAVTGGNVSAMSGSEHTAAVAAGVAALSFASGGSSKPALTRSSTAANNMKGCCIAVMGGIVSALSGSDSHSSAAAAVGVAASNFNDEGLHGGTATRSDGLVEETTITSMGANVSAVSGSPGSAAAAVGVATSISGDAGSNGAVSDTSTTVVTTAMIAAKGSYVSAATSRGANAAVGVATSNNMRDASSNTIVNGLTIAAMDSNVSSSGGMATAAAGIANSGSADSSARDSSTQANSTMIAVQGGTVSAVSGGLYSATAAVSVILLPRRAGQLSLQMAIRLCDTEIREEQSPQRDSPDVCDVDFASSVAPVEVTSVRTTIAANVDPDFLLFLAAVHPSGTRMWFDGVTVRAPDAACLAIRSRACAVPPSTRYNITLIDCSLTCGTIGWSNASRFGTAAIDNSILRNASSTVDPATAFLGGDLELTSVDSDRRAAAERGACTPVPLSLCPSMSPFPNLSELFGDSTDRTHSPTLSASSSLPRRHTVTATGDHTPSHPGQGPAARSRSHAATASTTRSDGVDDTTAAAVLETPTLSAPPSPSQTLTASVSDLPVNGTVTDNAWDRAVPRNLREASTGVAVAAIAAGGMVRGFPSPGAAGSAARFTSIPQLVLCSEVAEPSLVELPWPNVFSAGPFAQLAERALAAAMLCAVCTVLGAALLYLGAGPEGLAQAVFIVPSSYIGPAVTGIAIQIISLYAQIEDAAVQPIDAATGDFIGFPSRNDVLVAGAAALLTWAQVVPLALVALRPPAGKADADASAVRKQRLAAALEDLVCGGLRETLPRGWCGLSSEPVERIEGAETVRIAPRLALRAVAFIEIGTAHLFTLLAGIRGRHDPCMSRSYAALLVAAVFMFYIEKFQPLESRIEHAFQLSSAALQLVTGILTVGLAAGNESTAQSAAAAGEWASTAGLWLVTMQALVLAVLSLRSNDAAGGGDDSAGGVAAPLLTLPADDTARAASDVAAGANDDGLQPDAAAADGADWQEHDGAAAVLNPLDTKRVARRSAKGGP